MTDERKTRVWSWIVALLIALPVMYVASFGPACWLCENRTLNQQSAWIAFRPLTWLCAHGPKPVRASLRQYARTFGDQTRVGFAPIQVSGASMCPICIEVRLDDSVSPIDYEVTYRNGTR